MNEIRPDKEEQINEIIEKYSDQLSPEQAQALPLIAFGMSSAKVAKIVNVSPVTIRQWMRTDVNFKQGLKEFAQHANLYHMAMLNQAGVLAWDRVMELLESDYDVDDRTNRTNQANMAKFVIGELGVMKQDQKDSGETEVELHVTENSIDLIARRVKELDSDGEKDIEAEYEITAEEEDDPRTMLNSMSKAKEMDGENFDAEIKELEKPNAPIYPKHPETKYGSINRNKNKVQCHLCGSWEPDLVVHIRTEHDMSPRRYRNIFKIPSEIVLGNLAPVEAEEKDIESYNDLLEYESEREQQ